MCSCEFKSLEEKRFCDNIREAGSAFTVIELHFALMEPQAVSMLKCRAHQKTKKLVAKGNFEADRAAKSCSGYEKHVQMVQVRGESAAEEDILKKKLMFKP